MALQAQNKLKKRLAEFQDRLSRDISPFTQYDPDLETRYAAGRDNFFDFSNCYTPHYVDLPEARFHHQLIAMSESPRRRLFAVAGPREHGKTIVLRIQKLRFILYGLKHYLLKVSEKLRLAQADIAYLLAELEYNARIRSDFDIYFIKQDENDIRLRVRSKATGRTHFVKIEPMSYGTPVVGATFMQYRPDYAEVDDFGNRRTDRNLRISREKVDWIKGELFLAMDKTSGAIVWVGNDRLKSSALHLFFENDCTSVVTPKEAYFGSRKNLSRRINRSRGDFVGYKYPSWIRKGNRRFALWQEKMTLKELDTLAKTLGAAVFEGEMQQNPVEVGIYFQPEWFGTYTELPPQSKLVWACWIDQSLGKAKTSDTKAIVTVAGDGLFYYIIDAWVRRASLGAMVNAAYAMYLKYKLLGLPYIHIEDNFSQYKEVSKRDFQDAAKKFGFPLPIKPEQNKVKKEIRIEGLGPLMENGYLLWPEKMNQDMQTLKDQLLGYPDAVNDDGPDALVGAVETVRKKRAGNTTKYKPLAKRRYRRRH